MYRFIVKSIFSNILPIVTSQTSCNIWELTFLGKFHMILSQESQLPNVTTSLGCNNRENITKDALNNKTIHAMIINKTPIQKGIRIKVSRKQLQRDQQLAKQKQLRAFMKTLN